jgi:HAD superfamily hydrolase (TIGR01549 family)
VIRAVLFDVDGVLIDSREANIAFYRNLLKRYGYPERSDAELARGHQLTLLESIALLTGEPNRERVRAIWEESRSLADYEPGLTRLPDQCAEVLERLYQNYQLGLVTSRIREGINHYFAFSGLEELFVVSLAYDDYPHPKPAPDPLLTACNRLGLWPNEVVYVGDAPVDLECAEAAGTLFIAYGDAIGGYEPTVCSFPELEQALKALG